jgi:hypothetical protein
MIVVRVELHSAITGRVQELARMHISNDGVRSTANPRRGDYFCSVLHGRNKADLDLGRQQKTAEITNWPRLDLHVWNLVFTALGKLGYHAH